LHAFNIKCANSNRSVWGEVDREFSDSGAQAKNIASERAGKDEGTLWKRANPVSPLLPSAHVSPAPLHTLHYLNA